MGGVKGQGGTRIENGEGRTERQAWGVGGCQRIGERIELVSETRFLMFYRQLDWPETLSGG